MARYRIDGKIVDSAKAIQSWDEDTRFDGSNYISVATGSQWEHETLYRSAKGNYWLEHVSQWQGSTPYARFVDLDEAAGWLLANGHEIPQDLKHAEDEVVE